MNPTTTYNVTYELVALDESGRTARLIQWQFEVKFEDTVTDAYGPSSRACSAGVALDTVPFDQQYECNCSGTAYSGANCDTANVLPQLLLDTSGQYIPGGEDPSQFTFYNRTMWAWGSTYQLAPAKIIGAHSIVPSYLGGDGNTTQNHTVTFRQSGRMTRHQEAFSWIRQPAKC